MQAPPESGSRRSTIVALCRPHLSRIHGVTVTHLFSPPGVCAPERSTYRFFPRVGLFILATLLYILAGIPGILLVPPQMQTYLIFISTQGLGMLLLLGLFWLQYRQHFSAAWRGRVIRHPLGIGAACMVAAYVLCGVAILMLGSPEEAFMAELLAGLNGWQTLIKIASLMVLPPIVEELFFRHYLLRLFPYENSQVWKWIAVIVSAAIFAGLHTQYGNGTTMALIFASGCIFAVARIVSGGLLVPILLHSMAEVLGMSLDTLFRMAGLFG
ncbi:type II CAAX endopeptidase family protein [Pseudomonas sp. Eqa60]|uniref:CPBP family intramembrane glutamic endopeptidase n=1 Tax=Pseudomonas sp. Eqa60 TaxID=2799184 RepID=UPI001FD5FD8D|nr:type II CAAX endopeptidase family protein [Pseudomonas sp. Eqa60]